MNRTVRQLALQHLEGARITEALMNRLEAGVRAFDPCLSCSTHADGKLALRVEVRGARGELISERCR